MSVRVFVVVMSAEVGSGRGDGPGLEDGDC